MVDKIMLERMFQFAVTLEYETKADTFLIIFFEGFHKDRKNNSKKLQTFYTK